MKSGVFPEHVKMFEILLVYKFGDKTKMENCSVSMILNFAKIFEKILHRRMYWLLDKYMIFSPMDSFRQNLSIGTGTGIFYFPGVYVIN